MYRALKNASNLTMNEGPCDINFLWVRLPPSFLRHPRCLVLPLSTPSTPSTIDGLTGSLQGSYTAKTSQSSLTVPIGAPSVYTRPCHDAPRRSAAVQSDRVESDFILLA